MSQRPVKVGFVGVSEAIARFCRRVHEAEAVGLLAERIGDRGAGDVWVTAAASCRSDRAGRGLVEVLGEDFSDAVGGSEMAGEGVTIKPIVPRDAVDFDCIEKNGADLATHLSLARPDVVVLAHPEGCPNTAAWVAEACLATGVGLINLTDAPLAGDATMAGRFAETGVVLVGDGAAGDDSPLLAARLLDAVRAVQLARERDQAGVLAPLSAWLCASPPTDVVADPAGAELRAWLNG